LATVRAFGLAIIFHLNSLSSIAVIKICRSDL
jgi:hypothetical protein